MYSLCVYIAKGELILINDNNVFVLLTLNITDLKWLRCRRCGQCDDRFLSCAKSGRMMFNYNVLRR